METRDWVRLGYLIFLWLIIVGITIFTTLLIYNGGKGEFGFLYLPVIALGIYTGIMTDEWL